MAVAEKELVVKASRPSLVTAADAAALGVKTQSSESMPDIPEYVREQAQSWMDNYKQVLISQGEKYVQRLNEARTKKAQGIGEITIGTYVSWDLLNISPIQLTGAPMVYEPNKILASGELALLLAVMWTNPVADPGQGFANPANIQLGLRNFRVSFDQLNLTTATAGPNFTFIGAFPPVVPPIILFPAFFVAPAVASPQLVEVNVTADITDMAQPYAAFATWHLDVDNEPPWFATFPTPVPPQFEHDIPMRYMIYPK